MSESCGELLAEVLNRLERIERLLAGRKCTASDLERLERLLPAVAGKFGSSPTTTAEMRRDPGIRATGPASSRAFGALLAKAAHDQVTTSTGLMVARAGKEANKVLWSIVRSLPRVDDIRGVEGL